MSFPSPREILISFLQLYVYLYVLAGKVLTPSKIAFQYGLRRYIGMTIRENFANVNAFEQPKNLNSDQLEILLDLARKCRFEADKAMISDLDVESDDSGRACPHKRKNQKLPGPSVAASEN